MPFISNTDGISIKIQSWDNKSVVVGYLINNTTHLREVIVVRYNTNGTLDTTFGNGRGYVSTPITNGGFGYSLCIQSDHKIVVGGTTTDYKVLVIRYDTNGTLDTTFGSNHTGIVLTSIPTMTSWIEAYSIALQSDKIIVAGDIDGTSVLIVRYNTNGTLDTTFGTGGIVSTTSPTSFWQSSLVIQSNNNILIQGTTNDNHNIMFNYDSYGTPISSFTNIDSSISDVPMQCSCIQLQSDGSIIVAGVTCYYADNVYNPIILKYATNGLLDTTFGTAGYIETTIADVSGVGINSCAIQSDGKIVLCGGTMINYNLNNSIVIRYDTNGSVDTTFGTYGVVITHSVNTYCFFNSCVIDNTSRIIATGFTMDSGYTIKTLLTSIYNSDGSVYTANNTVLKPYSLECFQKGTMILTPSGYQTIETLSIGDFVQTSTGICTEIVEIVAFTDDTMRHPLYILPKESLGKNTPCVDLYMSHNHAFKDLQGKWHHMKCSNLTQKIEKNIIEYYNIIISDYFAHTIVAENVQVETCFRYKNDGRLLLWDCKKCCTPYKYDVAIIIPANPNITNISSISSSKDIKMNCKDTEIQITAKATEIFI